MSFLTFLVFLFSLAAVCAFSSGVVMAGICLCIAAAIVAGISGAIREGEEP